MTLGKERVEALASNILECHDVKPSEVKALAALALLALRERAEPVAYIIQDAEARDRGLPGFLSYDASINDEDINEYEISVTPLYTAPPAPVVPKIDRKAICNKVHWLCARSPGATFYNAAEFALDEVMELLAPPAPVVTAETFEEWSRRCEIQLTLCRPEFREVAEITWNACRAAMLAAPPAPVAAGWIACSERMPKIGDEIFYYCEDDGIRDCGIVGSSNFTGRGDPELFVHSEGFDLHLGADITHWMPLPEAPGKN